MKPSPTIQKIAIKPARQACERCGGCMDHDMLHSDSGYGLVWLLRCIQCGNIIDELILRIRAVVKCHSPRRSPHHSIRLRYLSS